MKQRLLILCVSFGLSFATLVLYVNSLAAISLATLLITGAIVVATREDLKELGSERALLLFILLFTSALVALSASFASSFSGLLFDAFVLLDFVAILTYAIASRTSKTSQQTERRSRHVSTQ